MATCMTCRHDMKYHFKQKDGKTACVLCAGKCRRPRKRPEKKKVA